MPRASPIVTSKNLESKNGFINWSIADKSCESLIDMAR